MLSLNAISANAISATGRVFDVTINEVAITTASAQTAVVIIPVTVTETAVTTSSTQTVVLTAGATRTETAVTSSAETVVLTAGATRTETAVTTSSTQFSGVITSSTATETAVTTTSEIANKVVDIIYVEQSVTTSSTQTVVLTAGATRTETAVTSSAETVVLTAGASRTETAVTSSAESSVSSAENIVAETNIINDNQLATVTFVVSFVDSIIVAASTESSTNIIVSNIADSLVSSDVAYAEVTSFQGITSCSTTVSALLDIDGNTEGSPAGIAALGFTPLSSLVLAQHIESEPTATYTITADFDPLLETEITSVFFNDNPANVLTYSIIGADLFITANTPADVYTQASTFMVNRKVVPQFNESINYNVRFNTLVKRDNDGRNFYSNKFYAEQNSICFLQDDGTGLIDLYEEITPGTTKKLKTVGRLDYTTGFVEVRNLMITSLYDLELFFFVESLDSIIPTKDYFTEQNNLLVQSKTITFPTGEQVEISQYEKQTDIVDLEIYVTARSYALASPLTTVETRTATYVLRIVPDYNLGKTAIKQLLLEQEA